MHLLISHAGANKGVTGYFKDYLAEQKIEYMYLRHPFAESDFRTSDLIYVSNTGREETVSKYHLPSNEIFAMAAHFFISSWVLLRRGRHISLVIGFGSFNCIAALLLRAIFRYKVYFWGVDYSTKRFSNSILNSLYLYFETISCRHVDLVIQPTQRQEEARARRHGLSKGRSLIIPNGIASLALEFHSDRPPTAFLYVGSITRQHGILDLVEDYYITKKDSTPTNVVGGGSPAAELERVLKEKDLVNVIHYFGRKSREEMTQILRATKESFVGLAPYKQFYDADHVRFGDSLKIKEYLGFGLPFLVSADVDVSTDLAKFGIRYQSESQLFELLSRPSQIPGPDVEALKKSLQSFTWRELFNK